MLIFNKIIDNISLLFIGLGLMLLALGLKTKSSFFKLFPWKNPFRFLNGKNK